MLHWDCYGFQAAVATADHLPERYLMATSISCTMIHDLVQRALIPSTGLDRAGLTSSNGRNSGKQLDYVATTFSLSPVYARGSRNYARKILGTFRLLSSATLQESLKLCNLLLTTTYDAEMCPLLSLLLLTGLEGQV